MNLYEISADFLAALDAMEVDPDTGELLNADRLDAISAAFEEKAEATALYIKNLTAFVGDVKAEEAALPPDFVTTTVTTKPDKTAIKKAIQAGQTVSGAALVENQNLQIK